MKPRDRARRVRGLRFCRNRAAHADIRAHLEACSDSFCPPLGHRVSIDAYATKLHAHAVLFEAWLGSTLVGLVAAYFNDYDTRTGHITNVSVLPEYTGRGIATKLLASCLTFGRSKGFRGVELEVSSNSRRALSLYEAHGFRLTGHAGDYLRLQRALSQASDCARSDAENARD